MGRFEEFRKRLLENIDDRQIYWHGGTSKHGVFNKDPLAGATYITDDIGSAYTYVAEYEEKDGILSPLHLKNDLKILDLTKKENLKKYGYDCGDCDSYSDMLVTDLQSGSKSDNMNRFKNEFDVVKHIDTNNSRYRGFMKTWVVFDSSNLEIAHRPDDAWDEEGEGETIGTHYYGYPIIGKQDL